MTPRGFEILGVLLCVTLLSCSVGTEQGDCRCNAGGTGSSGGTAGGGGSTAISSGGVVTTGGSSNSSGGATSTGGVSATGGSVQTGGSVATGGTDAGLQMDRCDLPFIIGLCDAIIPVYWFNAQTGDCEKQFYGGCGGNDNRFDTLEACMQACGGSDPTACEVAADCGWSEIDHEILNADDCVCLYGCPYVILNQSAISRRQQQYDSLCDPMTDAQGSPCGIDDCIQPPTLTCVGGQCAMGSATN